MLKMVSIKQEVNEREREREAGRLDESHWQKVRRRKHAWNMKTFLPSFSP